MENSAHFSKYELACKCCGKAEMETVFMERLENLRIQFGKSMRLSSAYRCSSHNIEVSKTGTSGPHTTGQAVDVLIGGKDAHCLINLAIPLGFTGIGIKQNGPYEKRFIHFDDLQEASGRPRPWIWSY
jgi:zinc D-Ala-D-Ala carboxypeptidase